MKDTIWLVLRKDGVQRLRKTPPALEPNEITVKLNLTLDDKVFNKPTFESSLQITENQTIDLEIKEFESQINKLKRKELS